LRIRCREDFTIRPLGSETRKTSAAPLRAAAAARRSQNGAAAAACLYGRRSQATPPRDAANASARGGSVVGAGRREKQTHPPLGVLLVRVEGRRQGLVREFLSPTQYRLGHSADVLGAGLLCSPVRAERSPPPQRAVFRPRCSSGFLFLGACSVLMVPLSHSRVS
jgi:hypothetical protein